MRATAELAWLIDDLVSRTPAAERAVVLSADGLLLASSTGVQRIEAEQLSAVAASLFGLSRGAAKRFGKGAVRQAVVEMSGGYLFVAAGGVGACVALLAESDADVGLIAYEIAMLVTRVGEYLSAPARIPTGMAPADRTSGGSQTALLAARHEGVPGKRSPAGAE